MNLIEHQFEFLKDVAKLIHFVEQKGFLITGGELYRTPEMQKIYVQQGKSMTMNSYHLKRLAIDLNFFKPVIIGGEKKFQLTWDFNDIKPFGDYWQSLNPLNRWGGYFKDFKDLPHFERHI